MKKRIEWIDMLKGWGMLLVMFAHAPLPNELRAYIYTFHLPLFFFISGYLFNIKKYNNSIKELLNSKFKSLLVPYSIFSFVNYLFWITFRKFANHGSSNILKPLVGIFVGIRGTEWTLSNGTLWFVLALFVAEIILYYVVEKMKTNKLIFISLIIFSIIGYLYNKFVGIRLLWSIDVSLTAVVFLGMGYLSKTLDIINKINMKYMSLFFVLNLVSGLANEEVNMFAGIYGNYFLFYIASISGIFYTILLIKKLPIIKLFNYVGNNSFVFLALHQYMIFSVLKKISSKIIGDSQTELVMMLNAIVFIIITLVVLYPVVYLTNEFFPASVGKKSKIVSAISVK